MPRFLKDDVIRAKRGMVFFINLDLELLGDIEQKPPKLREHTTQDIMGKTRPCMIVSIDEKYNNYNPSTYTVIPIATRTDPVAYSPTEVLFKRDGIYYAAVVDQMRPARYSDFEEYTYTMSDPIIEKINKSIAVHNGLASYDTLDIDWNTIIDYTEYKKKIAASNVPSNPKQQPKRIPDKQHIVNRITLESSEYLFSEQDSINFIKDSKVLSLPKMCEKYHIKETDYNKVKTMVSKNLQK